MTLPIAFADWVLYWNPEVELFRQHNNLAIHIAWRQVEADDRLREAARALLPRLI